jgi:uncharacterized membrane protein (DUF485 family)
MTVTLILFYLSLIAVASCQCTLSFRNPSASTNGWNEFPKSNPRYQVGSSLTIEWTGGCSKVYNLVIYQNLNATEFQYLPNSSECHMMLRVHMLCVDFVSDGINQRSYIWDPVSVDGSHGVKFDLKKTNVFFFQLFEQNSTYASATSEYFVLSDPTTSHTASATSSVMSDSSATSTAKSGSATFTATSQTETSAAAAQPTTEGSRGLSEGAKVGVGVGIGLGVPLLVAGLIVALLYVRNQRKHLQNLEADANARAASKLGSTSDPAELNAPGHPGSSEAVSTPSTPLEMGG